MSACSECVLWRAGKNSQENPLGILGGRESNPRPVGESKDALPIGLNPLPFFYLFFQFPPISKLKRNYSQKGTMLKYKKPPSKFWGLGLFLPLDLLVLARLNRYPLRRRFIRTFYKKYHLLVVEIVSQSRSSNIRTVGGFSGRSIALESALALREATSVECSRHLSLKMRTRRIGDF